MASPARWWMWSVLVHMGLVGVAYVSLPWPKVDAVNAAINGGEVSTTQGAQGKPTLSAQARDLQRRLRDIRRVERAMGAQDQAPMGEGDRAEDPQELEAQIRATAARIEKLSDEQKNQVWAKIEQQHHKATHAPQVPFHHAQKPTIPQSPGEKSLDQVQQRAEQRLKTAQGLKSDQGVRILKGQREGEVPASGRKNASQLSAAKDSGKGLKGGGGGSGRVGTDGKDTATGEQEAVETSPWQGLGNLDRRQYDQRIDTPQVREAARLGSARTLGSGGEWLGRIQVDGWYVIGPFGGHGPQAITTPHPVEVSLRQGPNLAQTFIGKSGKPLRWQWQKVVSYPMVPMNEAEYAVFYGFTEIWSETAHDVVLDLGADDDARVWLNGQEVWASGNEFKPWYRTFFSNLKDKLANMNLTESKIKVRLPAGKSQLAFKLYNGYGPTFLSVVLNAEAP